MPHHIRNRQILLAIATERRPVFGDAGAVVDQALSVEPRHGDRLQIFTAAECVDQAVRAKIWVPRFRRPKINNALATMVDTELNIGFSASCGFLFEKRF